jgi:hypothetical protein
MELLAAITNGADAFLAFTALIIVIFVAMLVLISR